MSKFATLDDSTLVQKYIDNNNEQAFNELYSRYHKLIFYFILKMVKDKDTAKELAQQTYYKFLTKIDDVYEERGKLKSWIMRIAYNNTIDHFRKEKKFVDVGNHEDDDNNFTDFFENREADGDPEEDMIAQQDNKIVNEAIKHLSKTQKEVVVMRMQYEMPFKEIAEIQEVSINTALGRMRYARMNLEDIINNMDRDKLLEREMETETEE